MKKPLLEAWTKLLSLTLCVWTLSWAAHSQELNFAWVEGAGGVPLNVVTTGPEDGPAILFIHGSSQSYLSWDAQLKSDLAKTYRLIAFDLRGHGNSAKPWSVEAYKDPKVWADDVAAVLKAAKVSDPHIVGWSFGGNVAIDYIRHYGSQHVASLTMVGTYGGLIWENIAARDPEVIKGFIANRKRRESQDIRKNLAAAEFTVERLVASPMAQDWRDMATLTSLMTPHYVRRAMAAKPFDNRDLTQSITVPVLIAVGKGDLSRNKATGQELTEMLPNGRFTFYENAGHSPFAEDPRRFNAELVIFIEEVARGQESQ